MHAAVLQQYGVPRYGEFAEPTAGDGQSVLEVAAAGLNPIDVLVAGGAIPPLMPTLPAVPGWEAVGTVEGGRRVYTQSGVGVFGSMAERMLVETDGLLDVPDDLSDGIAVALGVAGLAAWLSLSLRAELQPGEHVLVLGASGALGQIAVQAAKLLGAGHVVAAARSAEGLRRAGELGADATVALGNPDGDLPAELRAAARDRIDVIVDPLWGEPAWAALQAASHGARLVQIGNSAGLDSPFNPAALRGKLVSVMPYSTTGVPAPLVAEAYTRMTQHAVAGDIEVDVEELALSEVAAAWQRQSEFPHRKLVLVP